MDVHRGHIVLTAKSKSSFALGLRRGVGAGMNLDLALKLRLEIGDGKGGGDGKGCLKGVSDLAVYLSASAVLKHLMTLELVARLQLDGGNVETLDEQVCIVSGCNLKVMAC